MFIALLHQEWMWIYSANLKAKTVNNLKRDGVVLLNWSWLLRGVYKFIVIRWIQIEKYFRHAHLYTSFAVSFFYTLCALYRLHRVQRLCFQCWIHCTNTMCTLCTMYTMYTMYALNAMCAMYNFIYCAHGILYCNFYIVCIALGVAVHALCTM